MRVPNKKFLESEKFPLESSYHSVKDQRSANTVCKQLGDLSRKINGDVRPIFTSLKIKDEIKMKEKKPPVINQQCAVYSFKCDLCDTDHVRKKEPTLAPAY